MLAGAQVSLTLLLTAGFAGSAASMFYVLRRYRASLPAAAIGGAVYGFSPALTHAVLGHYQLEFAVLPPLIVDAAVRVCLATSRRTLAWSAAWLGLLIAAQLFIGEEILFEAVVAAFLIVAVLALSRPRAALAVAGRTAIGLGVAAAVTLVVASWGLWEQFFGRLTQHGSPFRPDFYKNSLSAFVTPAPSQLIHFAQSQAQRAGEGSEYVAYLGWPLIIVLVIATVVLWRHLTVRVCGVTTALLLLLSIGAHPKLTPFDRSAKITLPWRLLEHLPLVGSLLPSRLSIVADGTAAALLAFAIDLTWRRLAGAPADPASAAASENGLAGDSPRRSGIGLAGDSPRRSGIGRRWARRRRRDRRRDRRPAARAVCRSTRTGHCRCRRAGTRRSPRCACRRARRSWWFRCRPASSPTRCAGRPRAGSRFPWSAGTTRAPTSMATWASTPRRCSFSRT